MDGLKQALPLFFQAFPDLKIDVDEVIHAPGKAAVRARMSGTHRGDFFGVPATQRRFAIRLYEFHAFQAGRISQTWHLEDWFQFSTNWELAVNAVVIT